MLKYALLALIILPLVGLAEAKTVNTTDLYQDVWLYGGERLEIYNNDIIPHSMTSNNQTHRSFDSERLMPGQAWSFTPVFDGDYGFHDNYNQGLAGILHVRTTETAPAFLGASKGTITTETQINIIAESMGNSGVAQITIQAPNGAIFEELQVQTTSTGGFNIPVLLPANIANGEYTISASLGSMSKTASFQIQRPTPPEPVIQPPEVAQQTTPSGGSITQPQNNNTNTPIANQTSTPATLPKIPTLNATDIQELKAYALAQINLWQKIFAILNATAS